MRLLLTIALLFVASGVAAAGQSTVVFLEKWGPERVAGPWDVACAPDGTVLVSDQWAVKHFSAAGVLLEQWLLPPVGLNDHGMAALMAIDDQGFVYMHAGFGYVQKFTLSGALIAQWRMPQGYGYGIAVGSDGNIFVGDTSHRVIEKFTPTGQHLLTIGPQGGPAALGIAADRAGHIYACDNASHRVEVFDLNGNFLFQFGSEGTGDGQFQILSDIAVAANGHVFVTDEGVRRVQEFGPDGSFIAVVGSEGSADGQFVSVQGIGTDQLGNVFVADGHYPKVQKFGPAPVPALNVTWGRIKANYRGL